ncbi:MAG TPA: MATE family efflux transporter, partial [Candidatus Faecivivens stercoripullorum]|nr:MATE family efflux transporter [Candidatus Faecivivens stercoripullorum]
MAVSTAAGDMTQGNPTRLLIRFAIPMMIGGIFQLMYNMVDTIVLGRFVGANALASIGATSSTTSCFLFLSTGMTGGISIVVSQLIGAGEPERVRKASANALLLTVFFGAAIGLIAFIGAQPLMQLLGTPADIIDGAVTYIRITCGLIVVQVAYNAIASVLKAIGDSRTPLYFLILCSFLNIVLDLFFVLALKMAVAGVAWATI